jgi:hypothetical protein
MANHAALATQLLGEFVGNTVAAFDNGGPGVTEQMNNNVNQARHLTRVANRDALIWKADGAMEAYKQYGIHPLISMGVNPASVSGQGFQYDTSSQGQNIGRAAASAVKGYSDYELNKLAVERAQLENDLLRSQISNINRQPGDAPNPQSAVAQNGTENQIKVLPSERVSSKQGYPQQEAAVSPLYKGFNFTQGGVKLYGLSEKAQEALEGFGHIGGTVAGLAALVGTTPLYGRDASRAVLRALNKRKYSSQPRYKLKRRQKTDFDRYSRSRGNQSRQLLRRHF